MYYPITIAELERNLPLCKLNDELFIAAFVIFGDAPLTVACAKELLEKTAELNYDYVITAEAKGIPLAHEMARQRGDETYFVARKVPKLYMTGVFEVSVQSITTEKEQKLFLDTAEAEKMRGKRILIVDDVISTGESLKAVEALVNAGGGIIAGKAAILAEGDAAKRRDITFLQGLPLFNIYGNPI